MEEDVGAAAVRGDEAKAFIRVEKFDSSLLRHISLPDFHADALTSDYFFAAPQKPIPAWSASQPFGQCLSHATSASPRSMLAMVLVRYGKISCASTASVKGGLRIIRPLDTSGASGRGTSIASLISRALRTPKFGNAASRLARNRATAPTSLTGNQMRYVPVGHFGTASVSAALRSSNSVFASNGGSITTRPRRSRGGTKALSA